MEHKLEWHLVRCAHASRLGFVRDELRAIVDEVLALYRVSDTREGVVRFKPRQARRQPLFQTPYLFAAWPTGDGATWHRVRWQPGVAEIIGGALPAIIPSIEVENWKRLATVDGLVENEKVLAFDAGDLVSFDFGLFEQKIGTFVEVSGQDAAIEISILGRPTVVYVPITKVFFVKSAADSRLTVPKRSRFRRMRRPNRDERFATVARSP